MKQDELIIDRWYVKLKRKEYIKLHHLESDLMFGSCFIYGEKYHLGDGKSHLGIKNDYTLLTDLSEIQQYLPDGHADKFTTKLEYVKCIRAEHLEYEVDKIYKVEDDRRIRNKNGYLPHDSLNENLKDFYVSYDFTPSTKEEFDKQNQEWIPQVGDWVVLQESKDNWVTGMNKLVGKCVQITDINKTYKTSIDFKERDGYSWCLEDNHFRKALPHEIPDNFVLPEKWCIKVNSENQEIVGNWFLTVFDRHKDINNHKSYLGTYYSYPVIKGSRDIIAVSQVVIIEDYTEITLEQFKKYVLKEDSDVDKTIKVLDTTGSIILDGTLTGGKYYLGVDSYEEGEKSSEIHIPELIRHNKTQVKVVTDLSYPKITINIVSKESKKVNPVTIKQTKISLK